jgi:hypothetical protein
VKKNKIIVDQSLHKWHKNWGRMQKSFSSDAHELYEKVKIEQFVKEKQFKKVFHIKDNYIDFNFNRVQSIEGADLILITDQKFSRSTCKQIIANIKALLSECPDIFLCLNRHYLNITGMEIDKSLPDDYESAIDQWLRKSLGLPIVNYSERFLDDGHYYTWVIPDQKFYIKNENYKA